LKDGDDDLNAGAHYKTGEVILENKEKMKKYTFVYVMGILKCLKYTEWQANIKDFPEPVEMDMTQYRIRVSKIRIIKEMDIAFISSPHYSEGHIFIFDMITSGIGY
jgi:hypothetical protein